MGANLILPAGSAAAADSTPADPVTRSLRLASGSSTGDSSSHLDRNSIGTPTDGTKWTFSAWVKRSEITNQDSIFAGGTSSANWSVFRFRSAAGTEDNLFYGDFSNGSNNYSWRWTPKLRDPSAWYNFMLVYDASQSAQVDKLKLYINGVLASSASVDGGNPPSTHTMSVSKSGMNQIIGNNSSNDAKANLLIADVYFLDGVAKTVTGGLTDFTESNGYGGLKPKAYTGSDFGNNGFHLEFEDYDDHSLIGLDSSLGGAINWDTSKYRTPTSTYGTPTWSENDTEFSGASSGVQHTMSNFVGSGKYYAEFTITETGSGGTISGVGPVSEDWWTGSSIDNYMWVDDGASMLNTAQVRVPNSSENVNVSSDIDLDNDRIGVEVDVAANEAFFYRVNSEDKVLIASLTEATHGIDFGERVAWGCTVHDGKHDIRGYFTSASWLQAPSEGFAAMPSGNHFEATNLSSHDILLDTPTKNYATMSPVSDYVSSGSNTFSEGNLRVDSSNAYNKIASTIAVSSGKWYAEVQGISGSADLMLGIGKQADIYSSLFTGQSGNYAYMIYCYDGRLQHNGNQGATGVGAVGDTDILQIALDLDNNKVWWGQNGTWVGTVGSSGGTTITSGEYFFLQGYRDEAQWNFGQDRNFSGTKTSGQDTSQSEFYYAPPTGFKSLNTSNLDAPSVTPSQHFDVLTYNGSGSSQNVTGVNFDVGMAWIKDRDNTANSGNTLDGTDFYGNYLFDTITGTSTGGYNIDADMVSGGSGPYLNSGDSGVTSFSAGSETSRGITVDDAEETNFYYDDGSGSPYIERYVAWLWKLGSTGSSSTWNSSYTAPDTEHYNASAGVTTIDVTPVSSGNLEVAHSLSAAPEFFFVTTDGMADFSGFPAFHKDLTSGYYLSLDDNSSQSSDSTYFPSGAAHADYIKLGSAFIDSEDNMYGNNLRIWAFAGVEGYSKFGTYKGVGSNGVFVYTGHRPKMVWIKNMDTTGNWFMFDAVRDTYNETVNYLWANSSTSETTNSGYKIDILSNGFRINVESTHMNNSAYDYVFCSFAESPFKHANAR